MVEEKNLITTLLEDEDKEFMNKADDEKPTAKLLEDEDMEFMNKKMQKLKSLKRRNSMNINDKEVRYLITKNNEHLSSNGVAGKVPVLLAFPLLVIFFLLLMIYL